MEKITLKRKMCVLGELESDESKIIPSDIYFNLPSFLLEMIDKETRNRLLISDYATNDAHGLDVQKKIRTEYRQVVIPKSYLECNKFISSPSTVDQTEAPHFSDKSVQQDEKSTVPDKSNFSQQTPLLPKHSKAISKATSISEHSFQSSGIQATTDIKLNEVEDLKQTFVISSNENGVQKVNPDETTKRKVISIKENNLSTLITPNIWKKTKEIEELLKENQADVAKERQKVKVENRFPKKVEEAEPTKEVVSPEEKDRRRKLVKMQKKRNSKYHINHNHIIINTSLSNNGERPGTENNRQRLAYNPKEAQEFIAKKKQERMMKKRMAEEDLKVKEELKKENLNILRRKQMELARNSRRRINSHPSTEDATTGNKFTENQRKISTDKEAEPLTLKSCEQSSSPPSRSSSSLSSSSHVGNEEMDFHQNFGLLPEKLDEPGAMPRQGLQHESRAREILQNYVEQNNLTVEDVIANFSEHAGNIKNFVLEAHVGRGVDETKNKPSFGLRLDKIRNMSHWLEDKISQTSDMIIISKIDSRGGDDSTDKVELKLDAVNDQTSRKSILSPLKLKGVRTTTTTTTTNFDQLGNQLLRCMENWNVHHEEPSKIDEHPKESRDPFDVVLKDLHEDDPLKIFNILSRKQQECRSKFGNEVKKIYNLQNSEVSKQSLKDDDDGDDDGNIDISGNIQTSLSYDDDFENDEEDVDCNGDENGKGSTSCQSLKGNFDGNSSCEDKVGEMKDAKITLTPEVITADVEPSSGSTKTSERRHESSDYEPSKILQVDRSQQFDAPESMESSTCSSSVDKSSVNEASHVIHDQPMAEGDFIQSNVVHMSPGDLELRLLAEMNLMEMLDSSLFQLNEIERSRIMSEVKQENLTLSHMLKSQGVVHLAQIDDIMKVLQDGFNDHHQQQQMELNRLQKQLQEQQEQQSALMKNVEEMLQHPNHHQQELRHQQQQFPSEKYHDQETQVHQDSRGVVVQDILGNSLAGVIELQKEAALNLARMTSVMMDSQSGLYNLKDKKASEVMLNDSTDVDTKDSNHGRSSKCLSRKGEGRSSPEEKKTTNIKMKTKSKELVNTNLNIRSGRNASDASVATEIEEESEKSDNNENIKEEIEAGSYSGSTSIAEEVSIKKGDFSNSHSYTSSLRNDEDSDTTRTSSPETSKTSDRVAERTNANEINKNNNKSKNEVGKDLNWNSFSTSMVQIQLKEELAMQEHKLLLLEAKSKCLEESYRKELKELKQQLKNVRSDDVIEKLTKKRMKMSLTYKMKKNELKRLMAAVHSSMDAQKMMMLEASSLHALISTRNQFGDKSCEGSEVSSPTISLSVEQSKHEDIKVVKSVRDVRVERADENVKPRKTIGDHPLKNNKDLFGNVGSDNVTQSHHHHDLPGGADDDEVIHSELVSLDLKDLGTPVYEGSSVTSKNISEEIPENLSTSYSASSSQSKIPDPSIIVKTLNGNREAERSSPDVDIDEEISYESSKSSQSQSSRISKSKPHAKFNEPASDDGKMEKKKVDDDDDKEQLRKEKSFLKGQNRHKDDANFLMKTERDKDNGRNEKKRSEIFENEPPKKLDKLLENNGIQGKTSRKLEDSLPELKAPPTTSSEITSDSQDFYNGSSFYSSETRDDNKELARRPTENKTNEEDSFSDSHSSPIVEEISVKTNPSSFQVSTQNPLSNRKFSNPSLSSIILPPLDFDLLKRGCNENKKNVATSQEAPKQFSDNSDQLKQQQLPKNAQLDSARTLDEIDEEFSWSQEVSADINNCDGLSTKNDADIKIQSLGEVDDISANKTSSKSSSEQNMSTTEEHGKPRQIDGNGGQLRVSDELDETKDGGASDVVEMLSFETPHMIKKNSVYTDNDNNVARKVDDEEEEDNQSEKIPIPEEHNEEVTADGKFNEIDDSMLGNKTKDSVDKTSNEQIKHDNKDINLTHLLNQSILPQDNMEMQNIHNLGESSVNHKTIKSWKDSKSFKSKIHHCNDDDVDEFIEGTKTNVGQFGNQDMQKEFLSHKTNSKENNKNTEDEENDVGDDENDINDDENDIDEDDDIDDEEHDIDDGERGDEDDKNEGNDEDIDSNHANSGGLARLLNVNEKSQKLLRPSAIICRKANGDNCESNDKDVYDNDCDNCLESVKDESLERGTLLNAQDLFLNKHEDDCDFNQESKEGKHSDAKLHNLETVLPLSDGDDDDDDDPNPDHGDNDDYDEDDDDNSDNDESSGDGNIKHEVSADDHSVESSSRRSSSSAAASTTHTTSTTQDDGDFSNTKGFHSTGITLDMNQSERQFFVKKSVTDNNDDIDEIVSEEIVSESDEEDKKENNEEMFEIKSLMDPPSMKDPYDSESIQKNVKRDTNTENQKALSETDNKMIKNKNGAECNGIKQKSIAESGDIANIHNFNESPIDHQTKKKEMNQRDDWKDPSSSSAARESNGKQEGGEVFVTPDGDDDTIDTQAKSTAPISDNLSENHAIRELVENIDKSSQTNVLKSQPELQQQEDISKKFLEQGVEDIGGGVGNSNKVHPSPMDDNSEKSDSSLLVIDGLNRYMGFESKEKQRVEDAQLDDFAAVTEHSGDEDDGLDEDSDDGDDQLTQEDAESITNEAETSDDIPEEILEHSSQEVECQHDSSSDKKHEENLDKNVEEISDVESQSLLDLLNDLP